jgi:hypothetical protein
MLDLEQQGELAVSGGETAAWTLPGFGFVRAPTPALGRDTLAGLCLGRACGLNFAAPRAFS